MERMNCVVFVAVALLCAAVHLTHAADLPSTVERDIQSYERAVERAQAAFDEAVADARSDLISELEDEVTRYTRRGDLDTALAIRQMIERLQNGGQAGQTITATEPEDAAAATGNIADLGLIQPGQMASLADPMRAGQAFVINKDGLGRELIQQLPTSPNVQRMYLRSGNHQVQQLVGARAQYLGLVSRDYGAAHEDGDYIDNVTFTVNGHRFTITRWSANRIIFLPVAGGQVQQFEMNLGAARWSPQLDQVLVVE